MPPASARHAGPPQILVLASRSEQLRRWDELLATAEAAGIRIRRAHLDRGGARPGGTGHPEGPGAPGTGATAHRLSVTASPSTWRRPLLVGARAVSPAGPRARLAAKFDPWLRRQARRSQSLVTLDPTVEQIVPVALGIHPELHVFTGPDSLRQAVGQALPAATARATRQVSTKGAGPAEVGAALTAFEAAHALQDQLGLAAGLDDPQIQLLPGVVRDPELRGRLVGTLKRVGALPGAVATAYRVRDQLDRTGSTDHPTGDLAAQVFDAAAGQGSHPDLEAEWTSLALEVLFHRELHSDDVRSPLLLDPESYLAPARRTALWRALTTSPPAPPAPPAAAGPGEPDRAEQSGQDRTAWRPAPQHRRQVLMLPGAYGAFQTPVTEALTEVTAAQVRSWRRQDMPAHLRSMGVTRAVVRQRLAAARGEPVQGYSSLVDLLSGHPTDVVVVDWADKGALLASLLVPAGARLVLRVHGVDAFNPWIHLIDWARVDALVCVSSPLLAAVRAIVGDRIEKVPAHVVPNLIDLDRYALAAEASRDPRTLAMVGWAQRVKDPLWAVEVLARLRARSGDDWRLLLVGHDFADRPTTSGADHAARFRRRAMADDVRDHLEYVGFTHDLPPVLARAGVVLSTSLRESQPVGMSEAVAAGALPVVRDWPMLAPYGGPRAVFPASWVVDDVDAAVTRILQHADARTRDAAAEQARADLRERLDPARVAGELRQIVLGSLGRLAHLTLTGRHHEAEQLAREVLGRQGVDQPLLLQATLSAGRAGELTLRRDLLRRWAGEHPHTYVDHQLRKVTGQLRELDPAWRPALRIAPAAPVRTDPPRRVLHVLKVSLPYRQSGYAMRSFYLLREQAQSGTEVLAVTALDFPPPPAGPEVPAEEVVGGVPHLRLRREHRPEHEFADDYLQAFATALEEVVDRERPDVIHVHSGHRGYDLAVPALAIGEAAGIPVVYEVRGFFEAVWTSATDRSEEAEIYRLRRAAEAECLHRSAAVVTLSQSMRQDLLARTRPGPNAQAVPAVAPEQVFVVPNAVDVESVRPQQRRADLVRELGLEGSFTFGYVSNLDHAREGHELLVEVVAGLREDGVRATALIVGDGERREELERLARRTGVADHVIFTGQVPHAQVGDYYALLDVFVVPRVDDRAARLVTPLKPYEAMAMGLPVVVSDLPALQEIIGDDERGLSFATGDVSSLREVLRTMALDPPRRALLGEQGRAWVAEHRTWRSVVSVYEDVYASLDRPPARP